LRRKWQRERNAIMTKYTQKKGGTSACFRRSRKTTKTVPLSTIRI
jgi:hypothetical protein